MKTCSVVNVIESSIARDSKFVLPIHCGPEIGVASTKAFLGQMLVLYILCLKLAQKRKDIQQDRIEGAGLDFQIKVRDSYLEIAKRFQDRIVLIDGHKKNPVEITSLLFLPEGSDKVPIVIWTHSSGGPGIYLWNDFTYHGFKNLLAEGIGVLFVTNSIKNTLRPLMSGGGQERGMRSGTLSPALCVGLGEACDIYSKEMKKENEKITKLKDRLLNGIRNSCSDIYLNGSEIHRVPGNLNLSFAYIEGESLMMGIKTVSYTHLTLPTKRIV